MCGKDWNCETFLPSQKNFCKLIVLYLETRHQQGLLFRDASLSHTMYWLEWEFLSQGCQYVIGIHVFIHSITRRYGAHHFSQNTWHEHVFKSVLSCPKLWRQKLFSNIRKVLAGFAGLNVRTRFNIGPYNVFTLKAQGWQIKASVWDTVAGLISNILSGGAASTTKHGYRIVCFHFIIFVLGNRFLLKFFSFSTEVLQTMAKYRSLSLGDLRVLFSMFSVCQNGQKVFLMVISVNVFLRQSIPFI